MPNPAARALATLFCCAFCCALAAGCDLPVVSTARPIPPLFVVRSGQPEQDWQPQLRRAVAQALSRKPNVLFTVESVAPVASTPAAQAASLRASVALQGRPVADAISADGAPPAQVELTASSDPAVKRPEVRVYVH